MTQAAPIKTNFTRFLWCILFTAGAAIIGYAQTRFVNDPDDWYIFMALCLTSLLVVIWYFFALAASPSTRIAGLLIGGGAAFGVFSAAGFHRDYNPIPFMRTMARALHLPAAYPVYDYLRPPAADLALPALDTSINEDSTIDLKTVTPADYPRYLGPTGHSIVQTPTLEPDWTKYPPQKLWSIPLGSGLSGFSVVGNHAITQEQRSKSELVSCYNLDTGLLEWAHEDKTRFSEGTAGDGPRATPAIFQGKVYTMGGTGMLNCLDGRTGRCLWSHHVLNERRQNTLQYGQAGSPLVFDNLVVVTLGDVSSPSLAAYDNQTGNLVWETGGDSPSYASPVVATLAGKKQIITVNNSSAFAVDPANGHQLWLYYWPDGTKCSTPVPVGPDRLFISCSYGVGCTLLQISVDNKGTFSATPLWNKPYLKTQFNNAVVRDGYVYGLDDGILCCVDLNDGSLKWKNGRYEYGQVLLVNDDLLVANQQGEIFLIPANPKKSPELTHFIATSGRMWTSPTLARGDLILRTDTAAVCYKLPAADSLSHWPSTQPSTEPSAAAAQ
jgi:outer membrane protein assembly factor BamB